eukprot:1160777-Pelagomonas_calceolata.AAC.2
MSTWTGRSTLVTSKPMCLAFGAVSSCCGKAMKWLLIKRGLSVECFLSLRARLHNGTAHWAKWAQSISANCVCTVAQSMQQNEHKAISKMSTRRISKLCLHSGTAHAANEHKAYQQNVFAQWHRACSKMSTKCIAQML